ncbi:MAG TPA: PDZ domain-containing protein, partial [Acidimicrobiia bacterium]|nr:PDZ domain-containing protein [Acidimicrobiia bacterium]
MTACIGQTAPARQPLPDVASLVEVALPCGFLLGDGSGVNIEDVVAGGAADGVLLAGDLLVGFDGAEVTNAEELRSVLASKEVGEEVALEILRGDSSMSLGVVLGANPDDPERPLLGVMIATRFERVAATDLTGQLDGGPLTRGVGVAGRLFTLDPLTASWGSLDVEAPAGTWAVSAGAVYVMEAPDTDEAALRDVVSHDRIVFDAGDWRGSRLLGSLGDQIIVSASRPAEGQVDLFEIALMLVD